MSTAVNAPAGAPTIAALLANGSAQIREETLDRILERAPATPSWHAPLVRRPSLPQGAMRRLAGFVAHSLLEILQRRPDLDPATARDVAALVERRLAEEEDEEADGAPGRSGAAAAAKAPVGEDAIAAAIARADHVGVTAALARDAGLELAKVESILRSQSAKGVTALAW